MRNLAFDGHSFGGFRQADEGQLLGHEHGISSAFNAPNYDQPENRFNRIDGNQFQVGDVYNARGMAPPEMGGAEGGFWRFAGGGQSQDQTFGDDAVHPFETSQWVYEMPQQQAEAAPAPVDQAPREDITPPPEWDPNRMYEDNDYFMDLARRSTEGMNRMPFVGPQSNRYGLNTGQSGYADLPYDPLLMMEEFYPGNLQGWQDKIRDPLDGEQLEQNLIGGGSGGSQRRTDQGLGLVSLMGR